MADDDELGRPDGHRHESSESDEERVSKGWDYAILAILVAVVLVLVASGVLPVFDF